MGENNGNLREEIKGEERYGDTGRYQESRLPSGKRQGGPLTSRGHLPPPFYNASDESSDRLEYPSEANRNQLEDTGNYGRGGYYGSTYDAENLDRKRREVINRKPGSPDNYRKLGDRRWQGDPERKDAGDVSPRAGYSSFQERLESGPHRGKGPRSYRRSDERIQEDLNDRLYDDPYLNATDIEVEVLDGDVVLKGTVEDRQAKRRAEDICESVSAVKNVENRLRIAKESKPVRESTDRSKIRESLL
jgi:osmotically-inducible protein OsmY